jgi:uncharacterized protein YqjF (DUF2071 family)
MNRQPPSSSGADALDEARLAVLVACHHRGPLTIAELARLLPATVEPARAVPDLLAAGYLAARADRYAATQRGRELLDAVLEGIESQLAPDDPAYVRRYQRRSPTLPFDARTTWAEAVAVNFRVAPAALRPLIPAVFELDLYAGYAFVSLIASRLRDFGLGRLPSALRMNFYQATYRAHVTYTDFRGEQRRGCYFVQSHTNSALVSLTANLLPEFRAHHCATHAMVMARQGPHLLLTVDAPDAPAAKLVLVLDTGRELPCMPLTSVFPSREAARAFLVDFYDAFSYDPASREVFVLQVERGDWHIRVVEPVDAYFGYLDAGPFPPGAATLDSVFYFQNTPYRWRPLVKERLRHPPT